MKVAFITGISGQDGSYLTEILLEKNYVVHGLVRRHSNAVSQRLSHLVTDPEIHEKRLFLHYANLEDVTTLRRIIRATQPHEFYHLAGQSNVGLSFEIPEVTCELAAMGTLRLLEILRDLDSPPKFLHASSSEIFGRPLTSPQDESTPMNPVSPYGVAKAFATQMVKVYRQAHGIYACNAICYNHESPRRGDSFVTRKIAKAVAAIARKKQDRLELGNLDVQRDWGFAPEYAEAMWRILQQPLSDDYVLATGKQYSLRDFLGACFSYVELDWEKFVVSDSRFFRPTEVANLVGNPGKASKVLGWASQISLTELAEKMVHSELLSIDND